jgi:hypothetical protein
MAQTGYSGAWRRRYVQDHDPDRVLWDTSASLRHLRDADTGVSGKLDREDVTSPESLAGGGMLSVATIDAWSRDDFAPPGPIDLTPRGHGSLDRSHVAGYGAVRARVTDVPKGRQYDYEHSSMEWPAPGVSAYSTLANVRGLNARPENNPEGHPRTTVIQLLRATRQMIGHNFFHYDERPMLVAVADIPSHSPALARGSHYVSPYDTVAPAKATRAMANTMRRSPSPWDEDQISDGYADVYGFESWGL